MTNGMVTWQQLPLTLLHQSPRNSPISQQGKRRTGTSRLEVTSCPHLPCIGHSPCLVGTISGLVAMATLNHHISPRPRRNCEDHESQAATSMVTIEMQAIAMDCSRIKHVLSKGGMGWDGKEYDRAQASGYNRRGKWDNQQQD